MKRALIYASAALVMSLCLAAPAQTAGGPDTQLDRLYIDPINGYEIRPPAGAERKRETSTARLVSWSSRDPKTRAIVWTLSVGQAVEEDDQKDPEAYAKALAAWLEKTQKLVASDVRAGKLSDRPAFFITGQVDNGLDKFFQRQVWVLAEENRFLIFMMTGPLDSGAKLTEMMDKSLATLKVKDRRKELQRRNANLQASRELLSALDARKLTAAMPRSPQWFLIRMDNKLVGFKRSEEKADSREGMNGLSVNSHVMMYLPGEDARLLERRHFVSMDQSAERWSEWLQVEKGGQTAKVGEVGLRQNEAISVDILHDSTKPDGPPTKKTVPSVLRGSLLSRATGQLLPRVVSLTKPASYAFATYVTQSNEFDLRTVTVVGPRELKIAGKTIKATLIEDQAAADVEAAQVYVDDKGNILYLVTPDGLTMQAVSRDEVIKALPKAAPIIAQMDKP